MAYQGNVPPPRSGARPQEYFLSLYNMGIPPQQAYGYVQQYYGSPGDYNQQQKEDASKNQSFAAIGGTVGTIGGLIAGKYVWDKYLSKWLDPSGAEVAGEGAKQLSNIAAKTPQFAQSGTLTISRAIPPPTTVVDASGAGVVDLSGGTSVINTPAGPQTVPNSLANDQGFLSSVNWGDVATGATTILAAYQAYNAAKEKDYVGTGLYGTYAGLGAASLLGSESAAAALPYAGPVVGAYGMYKMADDVGDTPAGAGRTRSSPLQGAGAGAMIGSYFGPVGLGIGAAVGALTGAASSWFGSKKGQGQMERDQVRSGMKEAGILDDKWMGTLADGSKFDFGVDGKPMSWREFDKRLVDEPSYGETVSLTNALVTGMGLSGQTASNVNLLFSRAAQSNAKNDFGVAKNNVLHFANQLGITGDVIRANTQKLFDEGNLTQSEYDTYMSLSTQFPSTETQAATPTEPPMIPIRPPEGEVLRVSPGVYREDTGKLLVSNSMRDALEKAYGKQKEKANG